MMNLENKLPERSLSERWEAAVRAERNYPAHKILTETLALYTGPRENALIFGDACKVNTKYLLDEAGFKSVTNIDICELLLDEEVVPPSDPRFHPIVGYFGMYHPHSDEHLDFIYGKSLGFAPKEILPRILEEVQKTMSENSLFLCQFGLSEDTLRPIKSLYTQAEISRLFDNVGFDIMNIEILGPEKSTSLLETPEVVHAIRFTAQVKK